MVCTASVLQPVLKVLMMQGKLSFELVNRKENMRYKDITFLSVLLRLVKIFELFFYWLASQGPTARNSLAWDLLIFCHPLQESLEND